MKVIYDAKVLDTDDRDHYHVIDHMQPMPVIAQWEDPETYAVTTVTREMLNGRRFKNISRGIDVVVALDKQTCDILGIAWDAFEAMDDQLYSLMNEKADLHQEIYYLQERTIRSQVWEKVVSFVRSFWS